jgi:hypothetical protein
MANKKFLVPLGLVSLASDPASGTEGDLYFNNISDVVKLYKNGAWTDLVSTGNLPSGGTTGQILAKSSNTNYAVEWIENYADYTETVKVRVKNDGTRALYKGDPVYVTGSDGTNVLVGRSSNAAEGSSSKTLGLLAQNLATNGQGFVIKEGKLGTLDTSAAGAVGDPVWLGVDGALIYGLASKPYAPAHLVYLGVVTKKNGSTGEIFVKVQNGFELTELHDVGIGYGNSIGDNEVLAYDTTSGTWINQTAIEAGLVDLNSTQTLTNKTLTGSSYDSNKVDVNSYNLTLESGLYGVAIRTSTDRFDTSSHEWDFGTDGWLTTPGNILLNGDLIFEGSSVDAYETTLTVTNPTADRTITLPDATGTVALTASPTFTGSVSVATDIGSSGAYLQITNDIQTSIKSLTNSVVVTQSTGITLNAGGSGAVKTWIFKNNGDITFPDTSNQSTAFLGISAYDTDDVSEGTTNQYFTNERAVSALTTTLGNYLTTSSASSTYLTQSTASSTYLTQSNASSTYLTQSNASSTYLTSSTASTTYQPKDQDLTDIATLSENGFLKKTAGVWGMDTTSYATAGDISSAVGDYIPLSQKGDAQGVAELDIDGFVPVGQLPDLSSTYSTTSHNHTLNSLSNVVITGTPSDGQAIVWDTTTSKWINETISGGASYPDQSGNNGKFLQTNGASVSWADETDPVFAASEAYSITSTDTGNWDTAYGWGDHSGLYLTSETDPVFLASEAYNITSTDTSNWDTAYGWGDHSLAGYLTEYLEETDPIFTASEAYYITSTDTSNWNASYNWGDHALAGYLTSYSETSTLEDVTDRGATTTSPITISNINDSTNPTSGALIVSGGVGIAKDVWIDGNLHVNGTTITQNTQTVATHDNLIYLNAAHDSIITNAVGDGTYVTYTADNDYTPGMDIRVTGMTPSGYNISSGDLLTVYSATSTQFVVTKTTTGSFVSGGTAHAKEEANPDLGFAGGYYNSGYAHAGLFRDASDGVFKIFDGYTPEPDEATNIDTGHVSFSFAPIKVESLDVSDASTTRTNLGLTIGMHVQAWNSNLEAVSLGTYIGESSITTLGTISSGTWNGNAIGYSYGGTGLTTLGTAGQVLKVNSGATGLEWGTVDLSLYAPKASPEFTGTAKIGEAIIKTTVTSITPSSTTVIAGFPYQDSVGGVVVAECIVLLSSTSDGSYYTSKILVGGGYPAGTPTANLTEYAIIEDGSMDVTFTADLGSLGGGGGGNTHVFLKALVTNSNVTAKVISTSITASNAAV